ncbi:YkgJ family cysteine cluster protein [Deferrisoma sp.]
MTLPPRPEGETREGLLGLHGRVEGFWRRTREALGEAVRCRPGCDGCCRQVLRLRPVEAGHLVEGLSSLGPQEVALLRRALDAPLTGCPLLHSGVCLLYEYRPLLCRTHGLLLLRREGGTAVLHHCPENFGNLTGRSVPGALVLDEGRLAAVADALDVRYRREVGWTGGRVGIDELLRRALEA